MKGMKVLTWAVAFLMAGISTYAQSLEEIVDKNIAAMGGANKFKTVQTQYVEGKMEVQGMEVPLKRWVKQDEGMRLEFNVQGTTNIQVVTSTAGWSLMPVMMQTTPQDMDAATFKLMKTQLDLKGDFYDYKARGKQLSLLGKEDVNGAPAYKLKIVSADGTEGLAFVDAANFYLVKAVNKVEIQGQSVELVTLMSDYRKTPEGFAYPAVTEQQPSGVKINIEKVVTNQPVESSLFEKPAK
ncbi:hypothetical protein [Chitinophaga nivalis]|uniref:Outer membrane lipoprotein-sorting protein n=1 Tax=Chitinophaga nivalis TaxID=2991709 RepID=A0ABT3IWK9_9BACT|nr:hypothetical protein [Chitinophaga nivalis]MCW3461950.1 hypothetical protein [Chitinophaga nivalis]MCW3488359.1 hypothetical protein [Chitinophaga nivalis]